MNALELRMLIGEKKPHDKIEITNEDNQLACLVIQKRYEKDALISNNGKKVAKCMAPL